MFANLIQIGNSRGLRIPVSIIESADLKDKVSIEIINDYGILIKPANNDPRKGWDKAFNEMHKKGEDKLIIDDNLDLDSLAKLA